MKPLIKKRLYQTINNHLNRSFLTIDSLILDVLNIVATILTRQHITPLVRLLNKLMDLNKHSNGFAMKMTQGNKRST